MGPDSEQLAREANRLYWKTEASVAEITDRLGLSRRALYDVVRPEPAGDTCPECGADLAFTNRLARSAGTAACSACGREHTLPARNASPASDTPQATSASARDPMQSAPAEPDLVGGAVSRSRELVVGGALLLGVLAGSLAAVLVRPRR